MNGQQEGQFSIHWGCLILAVVLAAAAVVILITLGWRWLWLVPAAAVALYVLMFVNSVIEDRWRAVTAEHVRRGVPANCSECGEELDVAVSKTRFKTRCPICGDARSGRLSDTSPDRSKKED